MQDVVLGIRHKAAIGYIWYKYGNGGAMHTKENHEFFRLLIIGQSKEAGLLRHRVSKDCLEALERILKDDYRELSKDQRMAVEAIMKRTME